MTAKKLKTVKPRTDIRPAKQYEPTHAEAKALNALKERQARTVPLANLAVKGSEVSVDHPDKQVGIRLLMEACGAVDADAFGHLLIGLANFYDSDDGQYERQLNGLVATVAGVEPRDPTEMMLAAQMAITHELAMMTGRQVHCARLRPQQETAERAFNKLTRTFTTQMEALRKHRNGGQQKVTVEHVMVNDGGQAIVGNVATGGRRDET